MIQIAAPAFRKATKQENEMRKLNCKSGDLAIIIEAYNAVNIGAIVKIIETHKNQVAISKEAEDHLWTVIAPRPLTYAINGKLVLKCRGPAPNSTMRPIRGVISRADIKVENSKEEIFTEDRRRKVKPTSEQV